MARRSAIPYRTNFDFPIRRKDQLAVNPSFTMKIRKAERISADHDPGAPRGAGDQASQRSYGERHASGGRGEARPGHVHEHGAAASGDPRPGVVIQFDDKIVEMIGALEPVARLLRLKPDRLIVMAVAGVLAPAVVAPNATHRQLRPWPRHAVGAPPHPPQPEGAARRAAVALALVGPDAAAAEGDRKGKRSDQQPAAGALARLCTHKDSIERNFAHGLQGACSFMPECYPRMLYFAQSRRAMAI